ncbi:hypothetical protein OIDMADRAFT_113285 [Oidiodendron maius Zn]|uniref:ARCA-like protein n=1 Tax=Oidiodendron maius (strain Zn) TaxID=913774 RepID=A0A0C3D3P7_OIDMZ|nr:hypothetical protein OIDMADRAFT_113285 [Oidiodendron maius Zn]
MVRSLRTAALSFSSSSSRAKSSESAVNFSQSLEIQTRTQSLPSYPHTLSIDELIDQRATRSSHQHGHQAYNQGHSASNLTIPAIYSDTPIWPLTDPSEALLLRHFVQNLATWLDLCDPLQHFQTDVPQRAATCRILLNAIFALSARHLNRIGNYDSFASNRYHQECLKVLIPMLNDTATVLDESIFAATIILRVLEEIDITLVPETNSQSHLLGIQVFVSARDPYAFGGGLGEAAFWVGLRQEIYSAMMRHKTIQLNLEHCIVDRTISPAPDWAWANRAVVHCADVLNCCFGELGVSNIGWRDLKEYNRQWHAAKPAPFTPIYYRSPDPLKREAFPEIWYFQPCHIIGIQHHLLAQIILAIFDPKLPRVGGSRSFAVKAMESEVMSSLRELCGIGLYNRWTPPGIFTASMGIALCGDRFTDRIDQEALLDVLVKTEKDHARPTAAIQLQMKESWGWVTND